MVNKKVKFVFDGKKGFNQILAGANDEGIVEFNTPVKFASPVPGTLPKIGYFANFVEAPWTASSSNPNLLSGEPGVENVFGTMFRLVENISLEPGTFFPLIQCGVPDVSPDTLTSGWRVSLIPADESDPLRLKIDVVTSGSVNRELIAGLSNFYTGKWMHLAVIFRQYESDFFIGAAVNGNIIAGASYPSSGNFLPNEDTENFPFRVGGFTGPNTSPFETSIQMNGFCHGLSAVTTKSIARDYLASVAQGKLIIRAEDAGEVDYIWTVSDGNPTGISWTDNGLLKEGVLDFSNDEPLEFGYDETPIWF